MSQFSFGVVVVEPALQAGGVRRRAAEGRHHLAQLVRFGPVLGVVDHEIFAAREAQREIAGLGLGLRLRARHDDDFEHAFETERPRAASMVSLSLGFEHDLDVELAERIVETRAAPAASRGSICGFAEHRHQHGKNRQFSSRSARASIAMRLVDGRRAPAADRDQNALEDEVAEIEQRRSRY